MMMCLFCNYETVTWLASLTLAGFPIPHTNHMTPVLYRIIIYSCTYYLHVSFERAYFFIFNLPVKSVNVPLWTVNNSYLIYKSNMKGWQIFNIPSVRCACSLSLLLSNSHRNWEHGNTWWYPVTQQEDIRQQALIENYKSLGKLSFFQQIFCLFLHKVLPNCSGISSVNPH